MATGRNRKVAAEELPPGHRELQAALGHKFKQPELLELALTHRSHTYESRHGVPAVILPAHPQQRDQRNAPGSDNEQLEFLGDAVLGLAITEALFREFPDCSEGELTRLRSNLVSRKRMAELGEELGLGEHLRLGRSAEQNGGRTKPALLANAAEAVLAAMYLDVRRAGGDALAAIQTLTERYLVEPELPAMRLALAEDMGRGALRDHKTLLQERVQAAGAGKLSYVDTAQSGPPHQRVFAVQARLLQAAPAQAGPEIGDLQSPEPTEHLLAEAEGPSKKEAQQRAAEIALANWSETMATLAAGARTAEPEAAGIAGAQAQPVRPAQP